MESNEEPKVTVVEYILGFCSFIPFAGVILGLVSIVLGALKFKSGGWKVVLLGVGGILFTIGIYAAIFIFAFSGKNNMMSDMQKQMAKGKLRQCVMSLEFYHQVRGEYPDKLEALVDAKNPFGGGKMDFYDQSGGFMKSKNFQLYYYERLADGSGYYLLGRGEDGQPFTADDLLPELSAEELAHSGYRKK